MQTELLPFNLEEALKNPERVVYRNGEKPLEWHWFEKCTLESHRLVTVQSNGDFAALRDNGRVYESLESEHCYDLLLTPLHKNRYWVNVFSSHGRVWCTTSPYLSEEAAIVAASSPTLKHYYLKTITFTI